MFMAQIRMPRQLNFFNSEEQSCEGKITIEECERTLGSFQTGKTPGNDGIPIEFYKTFWPLIGDFMVNSFNEAYDIKEMSSSQRHAIIRSYYSYPPARRNEKIEIT